jgi:hypothetical protein
MLTSVDAGIYGFNIVRHCRAIHDAVTSHPKAA